MTFGMRAFMLFFIVTSVIDLIDYKNPQITQYQIYDNRSDGRELNFKESYGDIIFGFYSARDGGFIAPDPSICTLELNLVSM